MANDSPTAHRKFPASRPINGKSSSRTPALPPRVLTDAIDASAEQFLWAADGASLFFQADQQARATIARVAVADGRVTPFLTGRTYGSLTRSTDGKAMACTAASMRTPPEVLSVDAQGKTTNISHANDALLAGLDLPTPDRVEVPGAGGTPMQMWILNPPGFDPKKKWPLVYLVHGGPQGAWEDAWSFRWNPEVWAAQGYVIALPNPRGSTGFGQKYTNEISGDWGGKCFDDLMAGLAYLEKQPYVDVTRMAAAGASFGGYMMNWFAGHTDKFKTLVTHCGVYNFDAMYATTDELWFDEFEHGGARGRTASRTRNSRRTALPRISRPRCSSFIMISTSASRSAKGINCLPRYNGWACRRK